MTFFVTLAVLAAAPALADNDEFVDTLYQRMRPDENGVIARSRLTDRLPIRVFTDIARAKGPGTREITRKDYYEYMRTNADKYRVQRASEATGTTPSPSRARESESDPPVVRRGKPTYPPYIPEWYKALDEDGDGQVGLYEWRRAGLPMAEFRKLDLDGDGLFTPFELKRIEGWEQGEDRKWRAKGPLIEIERLWPGAPRRNGSRQP